MLILKDELRLKIFYCDLNNVNSPYHRDDVLDDAYFLC